MAPKEGVKPILFDFDDEYDLPPMLVTTSMKIARKTKRKLTSLIN